MTRRWIPIAALLLAHSAGAAQFSITGQAHLSQPAPVQTNARYSLRANLSASPQTTDAVLQSGTRFAVFAALTAPSLACYNDTIFRDDFDGDGF